MSKHGLKSGIFTAALCAAVLISGLFCPACSSAPASVDNTTSPAPVGNTPEESKAPSLTAYQKAIDLGGKWFLNNETDSFIGYEYDVAKKKYTTSTHALRQMGALWAITNLHKFTGDLRYKALAEKGFGYFRPYFNYDMANSFYFVNITPGDLKLGYSAFMILSLLEMDVPGKDLDLERLARGIIHQQQPDGSLKTFFYSDSESGADYYPGEALLAIMSMYEYTGDDRYLKVADRALPYYMEYFANKQTTAFVPWQTRAYTKYFMATGNLAAVKFVLYMNDFLTLYFKPVDCADFKFTGISSAVYLESVVQAYPLALKFGDDKRIECYRNFIEECSAFLLTLQLTDSSLPAEAMGGFLSSPSSTTLRCDNNQHAVMGLMDAYRAGLIR